jgi:hypothetical protein
MAVIEQAAKDHGGLFAGRRQIEARVVQDQMTPGEARARIEEYLRKKGLKLLDAPDPGQAALPAARQGEAPPPAPEDREED